MELSVTITTATEEITAGVIDDATWTLDVVEDLYRRAGNEALRVHHDIHPTITTGDAES